MEESCVDMLRIAVFPNFHWQSFTCFLLFIDTLFFFSLIGYDAPDADRGFLAPSQKALFNLGSLDAE